MSEPVTELTLLEQFEAPRRRARNPARAAHLEMLKRRRAELGPATMRGRNGESYGYAALSIPELDYYVLVTRFPDLQSEDTEIKRRAWLKIANSEVARRMGWLPDDSIGKKKPNTGIIIK